MSVIGRIGGILKSTTLAILKKFWQKSQDGEEGEMIKSIGTKPIKYGVSCLLCIIFLGLTTNSQTLRWLDLKPLEVSREQVEMVLGKSSDYFPAYRLYANDTGKFHVWYTTGTCTKNPLEEQWKVEKGKLERLLVYLSVGKPLEFYVNDLTKYRKKNGPIESNRSYYHSLDESVIFETISQANGSEFVYSVELRPGIDHEKYKCCAILANKHQ